MTKVKATIDPALEAQRAVFGTTKEVLNMIEQFFAENQKYVTCIDIVLKSYNNGYAIDISGRMDFDAFKTFTEKEKKFAGYIWNFTNTFFHPETFFSSNFKEKGKAVIEYSVPTMERTTYRRLEIASMDDVVKASRLWKNEIAEALKAANDLV